MEEAVAATAYETAQTLARLAVTSAPAAVPAAAHLAIRALLHPVLQPYRRDPLLLLAGRFPSLDTLAPFLREFMAARHAEPTWRAGLPLGDRETLLAETGSRAATAAPSAPNEHAASLPPLIGTVRGALYVPSLAARAARCRVWAAYAVGVPGAPDQPPLTRWPDPAPVRPLSADLISSAGEALRTALHTLLTDDGLAAPLRPAPVFFDVIAPDLPGGSAALASVAGDSLGLPLALAFLSTLSGVPLDGALAATGALRHNDGAGIAHVGRVFPVGWVKEKARALWPQAAFLLAPAGNEEENDVASAVDATLIVRVSTVRKAAQAAAPGFARLGADPPGRLAAAVPPPVAGDVTFVFTQIENSGGLWDSRPNAMRAAVEAHDLLVRDALVRAGGYVFKKFGSGGGDGFCAAFARVGEACEAALALQKRITAYPWPQEIGPLRVRVGIHAGPADLFHGDYFGPILHQTAQLTAAGHGSQIVLAEAVAQRAQALVSPENGWRVLPLGTHRLRDLSQPVGIWQLSCPPLPAAFGPLRTLDVRRHNLPVQPTPLLGRDAVVAQIVGLLVRPGARLITLTGPGGVGKTRVALQAGADCTDRFADGVWFVSLADARAASDVAQAIASSVLLVRGGGGEPGELNTLLASKQMLLVLDNLENVLPGAAPLISDLLRSAPGVVCLATSRALLRVRGEQRVEVPPLLVPDQDLSDEDARLASAIDLFRACARAARHDWELSPGDMPFLRAIVQRLDGLPLAIELAAARVRTLPLREIEARLAGSLDLLKTRLRDVPERHRTLQATLEWSYTLLDPDERSLLGRLSVFAGGFAADAARAVSNNDPDTLDLLNGLEEKSLVVCRIEAETARYGLLTLVRDFAREKLAAEPATQAAARAAHAAYFGALVRQCDAQANTLAEVEAFDRLEADSENLRVAFDHLRAHDPAGLPDFVMSAYRFLRRRHYGRELVAWLREAVAVVGDNDVPLAGPLQIRLANAELDAGEARAAEARAQKVLAGARAAARANHDLAAQALNLLGLAAFAAPGRAAEAVALHAEALRLSRKDNNRGGIAISLTNLAPACARNNDNAQARAHLEEAIGLWRQLDDNRFLASALNNLGMMVEEEGDLSAARALYEELLGLARRSKDTFHVALALIALGELCEKQNDIEAAVILAAASEALFVRLAHVLGRHAAACLVRCEERYGAARLRALRDDFSRRSVSYLSHLTPTSRRLALPPGP